MEMQMHCQDCLTKTKMMKITQKLGNWSITLSAAGSSSHISDVAEAQTRNSVVEEKCSHTAVLVVLAADSCSHFHSRRREQLEDQEDVSWIQALNVKGHQEKDPQIGPILRMMRNNARKQLQDSTDPALRSLWSQWSR